jgi:hypothetical protein
VIALDAGAGRDGAFDVAPELPGLPPGERSSLRTAGASPVTRAGDVVPVLVAAEDAEGAGVFALMNLRSRGSKTIPEAVPPPMRPGPPATIDRVTRTGTAALASSSRTMPRGGRSSTRTFSLSLRAKRSEEPPCDAGVMMP